MRKALCLPEWIALILFCYFNILETKNKDFSMKIIPLFSFLLYVLKNRFRKDDNDYLKKF